MSLGASIGVAVGATVLLAFVGRILWSIHKGLNVFEDVRTDVKQLSDDVADVHKSLNNGIRSEVRAAHEQAAKATALAGDAARAASIADQHAADGREEITRSVNALRAELDVMTNVVLSDRRGIRRALRDLGVEVDDDE